VATNDRPDPAEASGVTLSSGPLEATFLPALGMLGTSLRHRGDELLALPGGLGGYRAGDVTGLPLLAPWANRLGARRYAAAGLAVDVGDLDLYTDELGLPIHGTMTAQPGWEVVAVGERSLAARFDFGARPDLLASFPFPHELRIDASVEATGLSVATRLTPTADRPVPVTFGYHPYFRLPGARRDDVRLALPARRHLELDDRQLPTGVARAEVAEDAPIGTRRFDDLYELHDDRELALAGGGRRLVLALEDGYRYAQVFAPPGADFVCLEPMTAAVNALVDGGYALVEPGTSYTARFSVRVEDDPGGEPAGDGAGHSSS
jgi:galactose mutarotase-like enzyme